MSRLTHSLGGFIRAIQMSSAQLFAFAEGRLDRSFFDRLLARNCGDAKIKFQVFASKELPGDTGGKPRLLSAFKQFRSRGLLKCTAFDKRMACIFFADKDADDYLRTRLRSSHLVYSPTYDLEGHLHACADMHRALADSCGITLEQARNLLGDSQTWLDNAASSWRDWIALCLISQQHKVNCGCTFDRASPINTRPPFSGPDTTLLNQFKDSLAAGIGITRDAFDKLYSRTLKSVDASLHAGQPMRYFKGKWLHHLMRQFISSANRPADMNANAVGEQLNTALVAQVGERSMCRCCSVYVSALDPILADLS